MSKSVEHYTPEYVLDAARAVMGGFDLDPASCEKANERVKALMYAYPPIDGLKIVWGGRVWLNPPGGLTADRKSSIGVWWKKLLEEVAAGRVYEACFFAFSLEALQSNQSMLDFPVCVFSKRVRHYKPGGELGMQPTHASALVYIGDNDARFAQTFAPLGRVVMPWR